MVQGGEVYDYGADARDYIEVVQLERKEGLTNVTPFYEVDVTGRTVVRLDDADFIEWYEEHNRIPIREFIRALVTDVITELAVRARAGDGTITQDAIIKATKNAGQGFEQEVRWFCQTQLGMFMTGDDGIAYAWQIGAQEANAGS